jgi:transcriptional regulator with GAF, ATPase, and Fis domain
VVWTSDSDASSLSREALAITAALVAPLRAFAETRGVLYLDFRDVRVQISESTVEFFRAAAALVSTVLEQTRALDAAREDLRVAAACEPVPMPSLDELLWAPSMKSLRREIESALVGDSSILILGESGTGKTAVARAIADAIGRPPVVRAVLGASDDLNTITSELFGHERGAFSGAMNRRVGLVELADRGTLILDEILNLPKHAQQLLLDFSQFGTYRPLGHEAVKPKQVKVGLIAATNGDLDTAVKEGRFRLDLYYRLAGAVVRLPSLRERHEEIPLLAEAYLRRLDQERDWTLMSGRSCR